jgi:ketosteroid isomerase-like protein
VPDEPASDSAAVDVVRRIYALWDRHESASHLIDDDLEYVNPPYAVETGVSRGRGALGKIRDVYPDMLIRAERIIDAGENVVVLCSLVGSSVSGVRMDIHQAYVWTVRDGRAIRFRWFNELGEALAAVGLSPADVDSR